MANKIKELQDRAAAVAAELEELHNVEERSEEQNEKLARLTQEADSIVPELQHEKAIADRISAIRAASQAAAAPVEVAAVEKPARKPAARYTRLKGFESADDAEVCGHWIRGFLLGREDSRNWYHHNVEERALASSDNSKGGVFIPETFASSLIRLVDSFTAIPQQANVVPMSSSSLYIPRRTGGNTAYFVAENSETTTSDIATDNVLLSAKDCRVGSRVPNSLIEDSVIDLAGLVAQEFALALSRKIDDAGLAGDGTSTHGGIRGIQWLFENESLAGTNDSGESALSSLTIDDFAETIGLLPSYARATAGWYVTPQVYSTAMLPLMLSAGGVSAAELASGASEQRFMGYPVYFNNSMRTSVSNGQAVCLFGDLRLSTHYGLRRDITVRASTDRYIEFDQTYFQATCRFDIVTSDVGDASTAGPVVALTL
jgi:HK97 family phage major capsid protein